MFLLMTPIALAVKVHGRPHAVQLLDRYWTTRRAIDAQRTT